MFAVRGRVVALCSFLVRSTRGGGLRSRAWSPLFLAALIVTVVVSQTATEANAQPVKATSYKPTTFKPVGRPPSPMTPLEPAPPLPAACAPPKAQPPTKDQCADSSWYASNECVKNIGTKAQMLNYCTWVFKKEWHASGNQGHVQMFPTTPPSSPYPVIGPARRIDRAKFVDPRPAPRPTGRRHFAGEMPAVGKARTAGAALTTVKLTPGSTRAAGGGYASMLTTHTTAALSSIDRDIESLEFVNMSDPLMGAKATKLSNDLLAKPAFVPTPGAGVSSCMEFAYKRYGDYSAYSAAAKRLGRNWRQVYSIATDPASPTNIDKAALNQTATNVPMPHQLAARMVGAHWTNPNDGRPMNELALPKNAFLAVTPTWLGQPNQPVPTGLPITAPQKAEVFSKLQTQGSRPRYLVPQNGASPLKLHKEAKARFDTVYGNPHDDELADIAKRTKAYHDLVARRDAAVLDLACAGSSDPCFRCSSPPGLGAAAMNGNQVPALLGKIRERITGDPVINPWDMSARLQPGMANQRLQSLFDRGAAQQAFVDLERQLGLNGHVNANVNALQVGGLKQKIAPDFGQIKVNPPGSGLGQSGSTPPIGGQCIADLQAKKVALTAEIANTEKNLTRLLVNELQYGVRGCLADPGNGAVNICEWSYETFAADTVTALDGVVEGAYRDCMTEVTNAALAANYTGTAAFSTILKTVDRQKLVFPCVHRRDFTVDAPSAGRFMELNADVLGRQCEVYRQNDQLTQNKNAIASEMAGVKWDPTAGEISDSAVDSLDIGSRDGLGASFEYNASWKMKKNSTNPYANNGDVSTSCRFEGSASSKVVAALHFFGEDLTLFSLKGGGNARIENNAPKVSTVHTQASYYDFDQFQSKDIFKRAAGPALPNEQVVTSSPQVRLGGDEVDFWIWVGPVPLHVVFGFAVSMGLDYKFAGNPGNNCTSLEGPSQFRLVSVIDPYVRADAWADASIDVVVAAAGVRLDLLILKLGIPLGVNVSHATGGFWQFNNGGRITLEMLTGRLTAYVEVGAPPLEESWEAEIYGWDGFHTDLASWGLNKSISNQTIRTALAGQVTADNVTCDCTISASNGFCCSMVPCANTSVPGCAGARTPRQTLRACTFNQADYQRMTAGASTTDPQKCRAFVVP